MKKIAFLFFLSSVFSVLTAQETHQNHPKKTHQLENKNCVGLFVGNTSLVQSGFHLPTVGVEYFREFNHYFGLGIISEFELGTHIIQKSDEDVIISEVERESAILILPTACIRVHKGLLFKIGYGIEFEKNHNLGLLKVGFDLVLKLQDPNWRVVPSVSWDHTKYFDGVVYGVTFGYVF